MSDLRNHCLSVMLPADLAGVRHAAACVSRAYSPDTEPPLKPLPKRQSSSKDPFQGYQVNVFGPVSNADRDKFPVANPDDRHRHWGADADGDGSDL